MISRRLFIFSLNRSKCLGLYTTQIKKYSRLIPSSTFILLSKRIPQNNDSVRYTSTIETKPSILGTLWQKYKIKSGQRYKKDVLKQSALRLYICCVELAPHDSFIREFDLPDTFNSWFRITELHLWMVLCRLAAEGKEGKTMRNFIITNTWTDIEKKSKKLQDSGSVATRKEGLTVLSEQFKASLFAYDEGLLDSDKALAGALWRNLFDRKCSSPKYLETIVEHIHKQNRHLDGISSEHLLSSGIMQFVPFNDTPDLRLRNKQILAEINKRI